MRQVREMKRLFLIVPLAFGIALDAYVAAGRAFQSETAARTLAAFSLMVLLGFWYAYPLWRRAQP